MDKINRAPTIEEIHKDYVEWALGLLKTRLDLKSEYYDEHHHDNFTYECCAESLWEKIKYSIEELLWLKEKQPPADAVVLTEEELNEKYVLIDALVQVKEELEFIKRRNDDTNEKIASKIADLMAQARKETAREFAEKVKEKIAYLKRRYHEDCVDGLGDEEYNGLSEKDIDELAKQYGVEIEE